MKRIPLAGVMRSENKNFITERHSDVDHEKNISGAFSELFHTISESVVLCVASIRPQVSYEPNTKTIGLLRRG